MTDPGFSYAPGETLLVCGPALAVLAPLEPTDPLVSDLLAAVGTPGNGVDELLELLVRPGLRAIADFAVLGHSPDANRVVVRGAYRAEVAGAEPLVGRGLWSDHTLPADADVTVTAADASELPLRILHGVALAARVRPCGVRATPDAEHAHEPEAGHTPEGASAEDAAAPVSPNFPPPVKQAHEGKVEAGDEFDVLFDIEHTRSGSALAPTEPVVEPLPGSAQVPTTAQVPPAAPVSGHTMPSSQTTVLADVVPSPDEPSAVMPTAEPAALTPQADRRPGFIDSFPWASDGVVPPVAPAPPPTPQPTPQPRPVPPAQPPVVQPSAVQQRPADMTIKRANLRMPAGSGGVQVMAVACARGHHNAPYASACRVCAAPVPPQQPVAISRPPLGVLRLDNGGTVLLDRAVIMGRNPRVPSGYTGEQPNLVQLPDPERDISSQHLEVRLDDWHVVVRDLGSTNGTQVSLPGEPPLTLRPNDPLTIEPGSRVLLAGVFSFTFEVTE